MRAVPKSKPPLTGLSESQLYHCQEDWGYFSLLWATSEPLEASATPDPDLCPVDARQPLKLKPSLKTQRSYPLFELPQVITALDQNRDTWISQAEFTVPNRRLLYLLRIGLCFVDLDTYKTDWKGTAPDKLAECVRGYCCDVDVPEPSLILYSGRGLQIKWLLERPLPRAALPRWNAVQKRLVDALERFGADPGARDASRLLRLVDTVNTRSGERVRVIWVNEQDGAIQRYNFEYLAEWMLPLARDDLEKQRKQRPRLSVVPGTATGHLRRFSGRQLAWDRLDDLRTLAKLRGWMEHGVPHGYRSKYLHWCLNFLLLSGATHSSQMFYEAQILVREVCPSFTKEVRSVLSTLYRKAQAYESGEKIEYNGKKYPPLYTPRNSTLLGLFDIQAHEFQYLKTIVPEDVAKARDAERKREQRAQAGVIRRSSYLETAEQRRAQARLLRAKGLSLREIAEEMGISKSQAQRYLP